MSPFAVALDAFHFIRPLWLLLLPVVAGLWWIVRRTGIRELPSAVGNPPLPNPRPLLFLVSFVSFVFKRS